MFPTRKMFVASGVRRIGTRVSRRIHVMPFPSWLQLVRMQVMALRYMMNLRPMVRSHMMHRGLGRMIFVPWL